MTYSNIDVEIQKLFPISEAFGLRLNRLFELKLAIDIYYEQQEEFFLLIFELGLFLSDE